MKFCLQTFVSEGQSATITKLSKAFHILFQNGGDSKSRVIWDYLIVLRSIGYFQSRGFHREPYKIQGKMFRISECLRYLENRVLGIRIYQKRNNSAPLFWTTRMFDLKTLRMSQKCYGMVTRKVKNTKHLLGHRLKATMIVTMHPGFSIQNFDINAHLLTFL